jgi:hypothetical protein
LVNREAREEGLKVYKMVELESYRPQGRYHLCQPTIYLKAERDIIYFGDTTQTSSLGEFSSRMLEDRQTIIPNIAIRVTDDIDNNHLVNVMEALHGNFPTASGYQEWLEPFSGFRLPGFPVLRRSS